MKRKYIKLTASMPKTLVSELDRVALAKGETRSSLMRKLITAHCVENGFLKRPAY